MPKDTKTREVLRRIKIAENQELSHLDLAELGLTDVPPEVERVTTLKILNLGGNRLTDVPPVVFRLAAGGGPG